MEKWNLYILNRMSENNMALKEGEKGFPLISISISSKYYPESFFFSYLVGKREFEVLKNMIFLILLCVIEFFISLMQTFTRRMISVEQWILFHMQVNSQHRDMKSIFHISLMSQYVNFPFHLMIRHQMILQKMEKCRHFYSSLNLIESKGLQKG